MRVHIVAILGVLIGAFILVVATLTLNGTTLQSFQTLDHQARLQDKSWRRPHRAPLPGG